MKRCNHATRTLIQVFSSSSPSPLDPGRKWLVVVCQHCKQIKRGYLKTSGQFKMTSTFQITWTQVMYYKKESQR